MLVLEAGKIKKYYRDKLIIGFEELKVYAGDKIGIVGRNGSGKTTLLNILAGAVEPDAGFVKRYCDIAYIRQFAAEMIEAGPKIIKEFNLADQKTFSGGEQTRIKIANALSQGKLLLFADEPTANLDYQGIELLQQKFAALDSVCVISHDRLLLDRLCNRIIEIKNGGLNFYNGNYSFYQEQSKLEAERAVQEYEQYRTEKANLEAAVRERQHRSATIKKTPKRMGNSEARLHRRQANEKQEKINNAANNLRMRLAKLEVKERPPLLPKIKLDLALTDPPANKIVISAAQLTFGYDAKQIFNNTGFKVYNGSKTALWGTNGSGKTTLLNLVARVNVSGNQPAAIQIVPKAKLGYFYQNFANLEPKRSVLENVMQESQQTETVARTILARLLISGDTVYQLVARLSGGERIKVAFAKLLVSNYNVLLLDEPANYLDIQSIAAVEEVLGDYEGTVLFVSHDRAFVNTVADRLLLIENQKIIEFAGKLHDLETGKSNLSTKVDQTDQMVVRLKIAAVVAKLSQPQADREVLEAEYQSLIAQLKQLN